MNIRIINSRSRIVFILGGVAAGIIGLVFRKVLIVEGSLLLVGFLIVASEVSSAPRPFTTGQSRILVFGEIATLSVAVIAMDFVRESSRPLLFFAVMGLFYALMFVETRKIQTSTPAYLLKWLTGQAVMFGTFYALYPGFVAIDSYRDLSIASYIIAAGGGLPHFFTNIVWYNSTPFAPIVYALTSLTTGFAINVSEAILGFVFVILIVLVVGSISLIISDDPRTYLTAIWFGGLLPFLWVFSTWPIPEMLAMAFAVTALLMILKQRSQPMLAVAILLLSLTFTHGGIALEFLGMLVIMYLFSRKSIFIKGVAVLSVGLLTYIVFVSVANTTSGLITIRSFLSALLAPQSVFFVPNITGNSLVTILLQVSENVADSYWYVFAVVIAFIGFDRIMKSSKRSNSKEIRGLSVSLAFVLGASVIFSAAGSQLGEVSRYVSLMGFALAPVIMAVGFNHTFGASRSARVMATVSVAVLIASSVCYGLTSPDLWQNLGQSQFAVTQRLGASTTTGELASQTYLNAFDARYSVAANYLPEFVSITQLRVADQLVGLNEFTMFGVDVVTAPQPPYVLLLSERATALNFPDANPVANPVARVVDLPGDLVYDSPSSQVLFERTYAG